MSAAADRPGGTGRGDPPLRAILFDAGNTLVFLDRDRMIRIFASCGLSVEPEAFREAELAARLALTRHLDRTEQVTGTETHVWGAYFGEILEACGATGETAERVGREVRRVHAEEHLWRHVPEDTPSTLAALREAGYRLGVISNADGRIPWLFERLGLHGHFDVVVDSGEVGVEKPDRRIFRVALDALGLPPEACLYAGDLYPVDVVGARRAGLRALLVDPWDAFPGRDVDRVASVAGVPEYVRGL